MVKTPRTRHSKSSREPVTIDLSPDEVSRLDEERKAAEAEASPVDQPAETDAPTQPAEAVDASETPAEPFEPEATTEKPVRDLPEGESPYSTASSSSFGRSESVRSPGAAKRGSSGSLLAGVAGGVIALAIAGGLHFAGLLPGSRSVLEDHTPAIASLEEQVAALRQQVASAPSGGADTSALEARLQEAEQRLATVTEQVEGLRQEVASAAQTAGDAGTIDLTPVEERLTNLENAIRELRENPATDEAALGEMSNDVASLRELVTNVQNAQSQLTGRLEGLETRISEFASRLDEQADAPSTAMVIAVSALKAAVDRGVPFKAELDTIAALTPDAAELDGLRPYAQNGVATLAQLAAEADAAANAMIAAERPVDPDAGIADKLWQSAMGLVQVRPVGMVEGDGVPEIAARIDAAVEAGNLERALTEYENLPDAAKEAGKPFIEKVRARREVDQLVEQALAAALRS